jgi:hypothetical protein
MGRGAYIDPATNNRRIESHPKPSNPNEPPHAHLYDRTGARLDAESHVYKRKRFDSPEVHLPMKYPAVIAAGVAQRHGDQTQPPGNPPLSRTDADRRYSYGLTRNAPGRKNNTAKYRPDSSSGSFWSPLVTVARSIAAGVVHCCKVIVLPPQHTFPPEFWQRLEAMKQAEHRSNLEMAGIWTIQQRHRASHQAMHNNFAHQVQRQHAGSWAQPSHVPTHAPFHHVQHKRLQPMPTAMQAGTSGFPLAGTPNQTFGTQQPAGGTLGASGALGAVTDPGRGRQFNSRPPPTSSMYYGGLTGYPNTVTNGDLMRSHFGHRRGHISLAGARHGNHIDPFASKNLGTYCPHGGRQHGHARR